MFTIDFINSKGIREGGFVTSNSDTVLAQLKSALETLKELPPGAKIVISYVSEGQDE